MLLDFRVSETSLLVLVGTVVHGRVLVLEIEVLEDPLQLLRRTRHDVLIAHVNEGRRRLPEQLGDGGHVAMEQGVELVRGLIVPLEKAVRIGAQDGQGVTSEHDVLRQREKLGDERQHQRVRWGLVHEVLLVASFEYPAVHDVGVGSNRVEVVFFAPRERIDIFSNGLGRVDVVEGRLLHCVMVAQVSERGEHVRLRAGENR